MDMKPTTGKLHMTEQRSLPCAEARVLLSVVISATLGWCEVKKPGSKL